MIICGCFLMVTAAIGVTAAYSKNHCLAFIYGFMAMSIMLIFIAMAIAILIMRNTMNDELTRNCHTKAGLSYQIDQIYERGSKVLCTSQCPCNADKSKWPAAQQAKMVTDQFGGESEYTDCPTDTLSQYEKDKILPAMKALERAFNCAGICTTPQYLLFSGVHQGPPKGNCKDELQEWVLDNSNVYAGFLMFVGILGLVAFSFSFLIFYMKKKGLTTNQLFKFSKMT
eukprot:403355429